MCAFQGCCIPTVLRLVCADSYFGPFICHCKIFQAMADPFFSHNNVTCSFLADYVQRNLVEGMSSRDTIAGGVTSKERVEFTECGRGSVRGRTDNRK
ncbi:hypothetical protein B0J14DRAFT_598127 [Halenospora varia]|nr:hypothetical protein B0J14DRAFT_598127 [Halenospora varia]